MNKFGHKARLLWVSFFFLMIGALLIWRLFDLTVMDRQFLLGQGEARSIRTVDIPAHRGMITDRQGVPLAVSTPVRSVWINPKVFAPDAEQLQKISKLLQLNPKTLMSRVSAAKGREFVYLQRQMTPVLASQIEALQIPGVNFEEEFKRYYPQTESVAQLIGFTNLDDDGLEGIELAYQKWLQGVPGKKRVLKDRLGHIIEHLETLKEPRSGHDLRLSIDRRIQYFAYHELQATAIQYGAKSGSVVVLDTQSGEVLAIANYPSFNPNVRRRFTPERYRNIAITDAFEPGSVIKPLSIASALESGLFQPDTLIDTHPSWMMVHGHAIRDMRNYGKLAVTGVLQHSSNVGVSKMVLSSPPEHLLNILGKAGIGQRTESGYPGESEGSLVHAVDANPFVLATIGFGYGMSVTALQLAKSYLMFANQGRTLPISLLHYDRTVEPVQVIQPKTARQVLSMMEAVLEKEGTGKRAAIPGYRVAGKTGTARIAGKQGYASDRHVATFVGIAPASNPRLIVAVVIHEPTKQSYYGGVVAAPLFAKVMSAALRILDILPDDSKK